MTYTAVDFVADQLKAAAPSAEWNAAGIDRAQELARMMVRAGIKDISRVALVPVTRTVKPFYWSEPQLQDGLYSLSYDGRLIGYIGEPDRAENSQVLGAGDDPLALAWSAEGHGNVTYSIRPASGGIVIVPGWASSSDAGDFRTGVKFLASTALFVALPAAGIQVGAVIGSSVVGPALAASYPTLAAAIGNVALAAAFNGGDMEAAVKTAALSAVGAEIGSAVGAGVQATTDVDLLAKMTAAATRAFITGKDVDQAVAFTLIQNGGSIVDWFSAPTQTDFDPIFTADFGGSYSGFGATFDPAGFSPYTPSDFSFATPEVGFGFDVPTIPQFQTPAIEPPQPPRTDAGAFNFRDTVQNVTSAAMAALQLVKAYKMIDSPQVLTQARATSPNGVVSALDTGVIQTRTADGRIVNTRPPAGVAQATISGSVIVNNGDGTYTLIGRDGSRRVIQYGPESSAGGFSLSSVPVAVWAAGAGLALAFLRR